MRRTRCGAAGPTATLRCSSTPAFAPRGGSTAVGSALGVRVAIRLGRDRATRGRSPDKRRPAARSASRVPSRARPLRDRRRRRGHAEMDSACPPRTTYGPPARLRASAARRDRGARAHHRDRRSKGATPPSRSGLKRIARKPRSCAPIWRRGWKNARAPARIASFANEIAAERLHIGDQKNRGSRQPSGNPAS